MTLAQQRALASYGAVRTQGGVMDASPSELIAMLLDGCIERLKSAEFHIQNGNIQARNTAIQKASNIIIALRDSLDLKQGGELAENLDALYTYALQKLIEANTRNQAEAAAEVAGMLAEIRSAWQEGPAKLQQPPRLAVVPATVRD